MLKNLIAKCMQDKWRAINHAIYNQQWSFGWFDKSIQRISIVWLRSLFFWKPRSLRGLDHSQDCWLGRREKRRQHWEHQILDHSSTIWQHMGWERICQNKKKTRELHIGGVCDWIWSSIYWIININYKWLEFFVQSKCCLHYT